MQKDKKSRNTGKSAPTEKKKHAKILFFDFIRVNGKKQVSSLSHGE